MYYPNTYLLSEYLRDHGYPEHAQDSGWSIDDAEFERHLTESSQQHPEESDERHHARAAYRTLTPKFYKQRREQQAKDAGERVSTLESSTQPTGEVILNPSHCQSTCHFKPAYQFPRWLVILAAVLLIFFTAIDALSQQPLNTRPALVSTGAPTLTAGTRAELSMTTDGKLRTDASVSAGDTDLAKLKAASIRDGGVAGLLAVAGAGTSGSAVVGYPVLMGGASSGNVVTLSVDANGYLNTNATVTLSANQTVDINRISGTALVVAGTAGIITTAPSQARALVPVYSEGSYNVLSTDLSGRLRTIVGATVDVNFLTANVATNLAQVGGNTISTGNGTAGTGTPRVTIASDNTAFSVNIGTFPDNEPFNVAQFGGSATIAAGTAGLVTTAPAQARAAVPVYAEGNYVSLSTDLSGRLRVDGSGVTQPVSGTITANAGTGTFTVGGTVTANLNTANLAVNLAQVNGSTVLTGVGTSAGSQRVALSPIDPCSPDSNATRGYVAVSLTTSSQIITGSAPNFVYVCSISLVAGAATNVAVVAGTGTVCATSIAGIFGGSTAATGYNFAANGGIAFGNGGASIGRSDATGENLCILVSAANQISGSLTYVLAP